MIWPIERGLAAAAQHYPAKATSQSGQMRRLAWRPLDFFGELIELFNHAADLEGGRERETKGEREKETERESRLLSRLTAKRRPASA